MKISWSLPRINPINKIMGKNISVDIYGKNYTKEEKKVINKLIKNDDEIIKTADELYEKNKKNDPKLTKEKSRAMYREIYYGLQGQRMKEDD